ncbi:MAG: hypothetical protein AVDCRST_MAG47-2839, partial [uncultured Nocardioidaceae bacterium]
DCRTVTRRRLGRPGRGRTRAPRLPALVLRRGPQGEGGVAGAVRRRRRAGGPRRAVVLRHRGQGPSRQGSDQRLLGHGDRARPGVPLHDQGLVRQRQRLREHRHVQHPAGRRDAGRHRAHRCLPGRRGRADHVDGGPLGGRAHDGHRAAGL